MTEPATTATIGVGALAAMGAWIVSRVNRKSKQDELADDRMARLEARMDARFIRSEDRNDQLEARIAVLEGDQRADRDWITRTVMRVLDHDGTLARLLVPWPDWYQFVPLSPDHRPED